MAVGVQISPLQNIYILNTSLLLCHQRPIVYDNISVFLFWNLTPRENVNDLEASVYLLLPSLVCFLCSSLSYDEVSIITAATTSSLQIT
jgi:hypothetical protein